MAVAATYTTMLLRRSSRSAPELGKACTPLRGYTGDALSMLPISREEEEAERLYYAAASATLPKRAFTVLAKDLDRRSADAGAYLTWLIMRGWQWPTVAAANVNAVPRTFLRDEELRPSLRTNRLGSCVA